MNCIIPGPNIKVLSKLVNALSKIGDDVYLEAKKDYLSLKSVNMTTTAYCTVHLRDIFFSSYEVSQIDLQCRIAVKGMLSVFKSFGYKDKKMEFCKIELEEDPVKIVFRFKYKHDVMVVRALYLSDGEAVNIVYNKDNNNSYMGATAQLFGQVLSNFQLHDDDMSLDVTSQRALIRNYITGDTAVTKGVRSQITLMAGEFSSFKITRDTAITFSLKPFRAAVSLADTTALGMLLNFDTAGRPALIEVKNPTFEVNFVIATLKSDDVPSTLSSSVVRNENVELPNDVNWDDFNYPMDLAEKENGDVVTRSPESTHSTKIRRIFGRCYEDTFHPQMADMGEVLAPDSDPD